jgi:hypothetical protein
VPADANESDLILGAGQRASGSKRLPRSRAPYAQLQSASGQHAALALGDSSRWLRYGFGGRRRSASTSLMMSRRTAGLWFANFFIVTLMATVTITTKTIIKTRRAGFSSVMVPANCSSSFPTADAGPSGTWVHRFVLLRPYPGKQKARFVGGPW